MTRCRTASNSGADNVAGMAADSGRQEVRVQFPKGKKAPTSWVVGETVSYRGSWWQVTETHEDTVNSTGYHVTLTPFTPRPMVIRTLEKSEDPQWATGSVVEDNAGDLKVITDSSVTTGTVTYYGYPEPPADPPELADL